MIQEIKPTLLSFASISAVVSGVDTDLVRRILVDFFQYKIELSRRTHKEAKIKISNLGYLHLYRNRELAFNQSLKDSCIEYNDREDISLIDGASAVLSAGGGKAYSVRSSKISKFSLKTPATNVSINPSQPEKPNSKRARYSESSEFKESSKIPFPYLQSFINDAGVRSKKVNFDYSDLNDLRTSLQ